MKLQFAALACMAIGWGVQAQELAPIYPISNSFSEYTDTNGYVSSIFELGNIKFGNGLWLPLVLNFSSAIRPPSPAFGQGWECPLFESKIVDVQQNLKKVELLGGKEIYLAYNQRTDRWKHYFSDHWTGQTIGDDFELSYDNVWKFTYHNGLISSLTTPEGGTILWNRSGEKLMSMSESGKSPALQIVYDDLGFAKQILLNPDSLGLSKSTYDFEADLVYAGIDKIHCFNGRDIQLTRSHDKSLNPTLDLTDTKNLPAKLTWDKKTGKILSDGNYAYQIIEMSADGTYPKMVRTSYLTGKTESFYFDPQHGTTDMTLADGTFRHIEMSQAPGPNYKEIRLIQETKNGVTQDVLRRSFDDKGHLVLEAIGLGNGKEQLKQFTYDDGGRAVSYLLNGKEQWKNVYDPVTGLLKQRVLPNLGVTLAFDQMPGGEIKESIVKAGGEITSTKTIAANDWQTQSTFFETIH